MRICEDLYRSVVVCGILDSDPKQKILKVGRDW